MDGISRSLNRLRDGIWKRVYVPRSCITLVVQWLHENHSRRITDNLAFWMPYQERFAAAVARKTEVPPGFLNVNSFLDGTQKSVCRPSDGPERPHDAQYMWYSGYYRAHGFKMQSMMYPSGKTSPHRNCLLSRDVPH